MRIVQGTPYVSEVKKLIKAYTDSLKCDLGFQSLADELASFPKKYIAPEGSLLAALDDHGKVIGCVAYHRHDDSRCEMKRLYVLPEYRKHGVGRALVEAIIDVAREDGYVEMVLDSLPEMLTAQTLYRHFGFVEIEPYYVNPMSGVVYMKKTLKG